MVYTLPMNEIISDTLAFLFTKKACITGEISGEMVFDFFAEKRKEILHSLK
jgi:hypothetical protein